MTTPLAPNDFIAGRASSARDLVTGVVRSTHDELTTLFSALDGEAQFDEESWERVGGGGGVSRTLLDGAVFEKAGINRSVVDGHLPREAAARLGGRTPANGDLWFFAAGVSLVAHPRSPHVPTVHLNIRYFEIADEHGEVSDAWMGGGTDLTPTFPQPADARLFHRALQAICSRHHHSYYDRFKTWCDEYFVNRHRTGEARGVGGIFFDHLRLHDDDANAGLAERLAFLRDVGLSPKSTYAPIVERRREVSYGEPERALQLMRRGRYVEFNLLHDRGTLFGLQTGARIESVLMSLPPMAAWRPSTTKQSLGADGTYLDLERRLAEMLVPREWVSDAG